MVLKRKKGKDKQIISNRRSLITLEHPKFHVSEQYRTIRTNIQFSSIDKEVNSLVVVSPNAGEGKSTTAANIAVVFAQQGKKVLLVDVDLRKPTVHYTFQLENFVGFTNVFTKQVKLEDAIKPTKEENLFVLTSGPIPPNPSEMLASSTMKEFLATIQDKYDLVVFDAPPVTAVTDGVVLANQVDGVLLVVRSGETDIKTIKKSKNLLANVNAKLLGVVLNGMERESTPYYYG
ncbi:MAG: CpsD/CapB family tyrosine-protein kinase [Bacillota bacterium]